MGISSNDAANIFIIDSSFINCSGEDGAILLFANSTLIEGCLFIGNNASDGGAVLIWGNDINFINSSFINNSANYGGAVHIRGNDGNFINSSFINNSAVSDGGAICGNVNNMNVIGCNFTENSASRNGGAVVFYGDDCNINLSNFIGNRAQTGGAIDAYGHTMVLNNSLFMKNKANSTKVELIGDTELIVSFSGENQYLNAISLPFMPEMHNVTYWNGEELNSDDESPQENIFVGENITVEIYDHGARLVKNLTSPTDNESNVHFKIDDLPDGHYVVTHIIMTAFTTLK